MIRKQVPDHWPGESTRMNLHEELACLRSKQFVRERALTKATTPKDQVAR